MSTKSAAAAAAERTRIAEILASPEAATRPQAALAVAIHDPACMPVDAARRFLARLPEESQPDGGGGALSFNDAMARDNPEIGGGFLLADDEGSADADLDGADTIALARDVGLNGIRPASH